MTHRAPNYLSLSKQKQAQIMNKANRAFFDATVYIYIANNIILHIHCYFLILTLRYTRIYICVYVYACILILINIHALLCECAHMI